ncbi:MAG: GNAT family N-acetyltransferase [Eubacteriales bacterium]|nr:GNAT family N-acetyltransferase [Eubacteriales bacterium]
MQHEVLHGYRHDDALRASFNRLAKETFGLDFEPWYQNGFWNDKYDPHSILIDGEIVANVSVNRIDGLLDGTERHYVQLGTVMTKPEWRRKGLIRKIMQAIQAECAQCDGLFLYAGDDVCGFYPKFGFVRAPETRYRLALQPAAPAAAHSVPMATPEDWQAYLRAKRGLVSAAAFAQDTDDLHMFYLTQFMQDCLYFLPELGAYVVASAEGNAVEISEVLAPGPVSLRAVCEAFGPQYSLFTFGFTPKDAAGLEPFDHVEEDCTFFVQGEPLSGELRRIGSFPAILHA